MRINDISTFALDTAHMYIQYIDDLDLNNDKDFLKKIDYHPLMKKEIFIQKGIITFLNNIDSLNYDDLQTLLLLQENEKRGSLNL